MLKNKEEILIGFIGQGFIGKSYADDFGERGYKVVRYSLEPEYIINKEKIKECDLVFIAVNAGTKPLAGELRSDGTPKTYFDDKNIKEAVTLAKPGAVVVIKSTMQPGLTRKLQELHTDRTIMHSPEFLTEVTAKEDAKKPLRNIIGVTEMSDELVSLADEILTLFPHSEYTKVMKSEEAELVKYGANAFLFVKILFANVYYDLVKKYDADWNLIRDAIGVDPRITPHHMDLKIKTDPEGVYNRRGAGRSCFIKDMAALSELYAENFGEENNLNLNIIRAMEYKNADLLRSHNRYVDILESVYGKE
jgi:UDPglucose 6-dehydrogenase